MTLFALRNLSLLLLLAAFPLISIGSTGGQPVVWWLGLTSLAVGALLPPLTRYISPKEPEEEKPREATDLGESCRVC